ncbi:hypothetical protein COT07_00210 [Candidatus Woesearchaeota archaeon CG07_land_8_20_14_0_80_44_23]|nr:MAG: hypothetical protein COT07_00210 [Candidatus Woesearchaeota archaeon CG07_land_8_20_14_0_80_44_23]
MSSLIGIDSRIFIRDKQKKDGTSGHFESVIGIGIKTRDYALFDSKYQEAIKYAFSEAKTQLDPDYRYYSTHDLSNFQEKEKIIECFFSKINEYIEKVHIFYTLFSKKYLKDGGIKVYGRYAKKNHLKLSKPTMTVYELISKHLVQCFPIICAWRLTPYFEQDNILFQLDAYEGNICEAQEEFEKEGYQKQVYPNGDCANPLISTADLFLEYLDNRFKKKDKLLLFENFREVLPELGEKVLVYPFLDKHLKKITPIDVDNMDVFSSIKHPVFWFFKGNEMIDSDTITKSSSFRNLIDYASNLNAVVKKFDKADIKVFRKGDYGVYLNEQAKQIIQSYILIGKKFKLINFKRCVPEEYLDLLKKERKL